MDFSADLYAQTQIRVRLKNVCLYLKKIVNVIFEKSYSIFSF